MPTGHDKIMVLKGNNQDVSRLLGRIDDLLAAASIYDAEAIKTGLQEIVSEYTPHRPEE